MCIYIVGSRGGGGVCAIMPVWRVQWTDQIEWKFEKTKKRFLRILCTTPFTVFAYNIISNPISFGLLRDQTCSSRARGVIDCCLPFAVQLFLRIGSLLTGRTVKETRQKNGRTRHNYTLKIRFSRTDNGLLQHTCTIGDDRSTPFFINQLQDGDYHYYILCTVQDIWFAYVNIIVVYIVPNLTKRINTINTSTQRKIIIDVITADLFNYSKRFLKASSHHAPSLWPFSSTTY